MNPHRFGVGEVSKGVVEFCVGREVHGGLAVLLAGLKRRAVMQVCNAGLARPLQSFCCGCCFAAGAEFQPNMTTPSLP